MQIITSLAILRERTRLIRNEGGTIAFAPTMGALHAGHMALVDLAKKHADQVIVSIFVNPKQFGAGEDLARYPRREEADAAMLADAGVAALWMPTVDQMYPDGFATNISVAALSETLCDVNRPGHFDGVATVVAKLFTQVRPDCAIFGEKDWQQLAIVRRMATDLNLDVNVIGMPTVREADGLALSSRNAYLDAPQRAAAIALPQALRAAAATIEAGGAVSSALTVAKEAISSGGFETIDYVSVVDAATLKAVDSIEHPARILAAARIGTTRLIDNFPVMPR